MIGAIEDLTADLAALHVELFPAKAGNTNGYHAPVPVALSDDEILERARRSKNGAAFSRLFDGDITDYASQSEAEMALACHLAFWTGKDAIRMDALMRRSGLFRDKWEQRDDYRERTIAAAMRRPGSGSAAFLTVQPSAARTLSCSRSSRATHWT